VTKQNRVIWKSYATLLDEKLSLPNTALCAVQVAANQFSSIPTRSYRICELKVRVPSYYWKAGPGSRKTWGSSPSVRPAPASAWLARA
jgi:predicted phage tail protein